MSQGWVKNERIVRFFSVEYPSADFSKSTNVHIVLFQLKEFVIKPVHNFINWKKNS